jgi:hypothetical protein
MLKFEIEGRLSELGFEYEEQEVEKAYGATRMKLVASGRGHQFVAFWWKGNESVDQYHLELLCKAQDVEIHTLRAKLGTPFA